MCYPAMNSRLRAAICLFVTLLAVMFPARATEIAATPPSAEAVSTATHLFEDTLRRSLAYNQHLIDTLQRMRDAESTRKELTDLANLQENDAVHLYLSDDFEGGCPLLPEIRNSFQSINNRLNNEIERIRNNDCYRDHVLREFVHSLSVPILQVPESPIERMDRFIYG